MKRTLLLTFLMIYSIWIAAQTALFPWCQKETCYFINAEGTFFPADSTLLTYPSTDQAPPKLVAFEQYGYYGFKNTAGEVVIPASSEEVGIFRSGYAWIKMDHKRYFYLDTNGQPLINYSFDQCFDFQEGRARVVDVNAEKGYDGYGFLDITGKVVIPLVYEKAFDFVDGAALVKDRAGWWLIDRSGEKIAGPNDYLYEKKGIFSCE
ncbi:MAG: WG repeat-containing protein [Bacteroidota bacterium]